MATLAFAGEAYFGMSRGDPTESLFLVERAQIFPFQYRIREARAVILATNEGIPPDFAVKALDSVLSDDPASAQLLYLRIVQKARTGEKDYRSFIRLSEILPNSQWVEHSRQMLGD